MTWLAIYLAGVPLAGGMYVKFVTNICKEDFEVADVIPMAIVCLTSWLGVIAGLIHFVPENLSKRVLFKAKNSS